MSTTTEWEYKNYQYEYVDGKYKAIVKIQEDSSYYNPRDDFDNIGKLVIRDHRSYKFPNELDFCWSAYDNDYEYDDGENEFKKICEKYYICWIDMYEHSGISFSKHGMGMQCPFDTSRGIGFWAVPKVYNGYDLKEIHETKYTEADGEKYNPIELSLEEAEKIVTQELKDWNQWCSGEIYQWEVLRLTKRTSEFGKVKEEWVWEDGCSGYYDYELAKDEAVDILNNLKKEVDG